MAFLWRSAKSGHASSDLKWSEKGRHQETANRNRYATRPMQLVRFTLDNHNVSAKLTKLFTNLWLQGQEILRLQKKYGERRLIQFINSRPTKKRGFPLSVYIFSEWIPTAALLHAWLLRQLSWLCGLNLTTQSPSTPKTHQFHTPIGCVKGEHCRQFAY